jgi:hypothetical protein
MKPWKNLITTLAVLIALVPGLKGQVAGSEKKAQKDSVSAKGDTIVIQPAAAATDVRPCQGGGTGSFGARDND